MMSTLKTGFVVVVVVKSAFFGIFNLNISRMVTAKSITILSSEGTQ